MFECRPTVRPNAVIFPVFAYSFTFCTTCKFVASCLLVSSGIQVCFVVAAEGGLGGAEVRVAVAGVRVAGVLL